MLGGVTLAPAMITFGLVVEAKVGAVWSNEPVGLALAAANRLGAASAVHGTPDDVPLAPRLRVADARAARARGWRLLRDAGNGVRLYRVEGR